jgi:hypothetical protein
MRAGKPVDGAKGAGARFGRRAGAVLNLEVVGLAKVKKPL